MQRRKPAPKVKVPRDAASSTPAESSCSSHAEIIETDGVCLSGSSLHMHPGSQRAGTHPFAIEYKKNYQHLYQRRSQLVDRYISPDMHVCLGTS